MRSHNQSLDEPVKSPAVQLAAGHYVCAEFADNGCGISPEVLPRIFEPFFTTKSNPPHRGLGLAWVYGIVTNHGGSLAVTSPPSQGTTVRIFLPAQKKIVREQATKAEDLRGNQTVLFVDDDETVLTLGQVVLSSFGYKVLAANGAPRALELFSVGASQIDLVITDQTMPSMTGDILIRQLWRIRPDMPVILCTGYSPLIDAESTDTRKIDAVLMKPVTVEDFARTIRQVFARRSAPQG